MPHVWIHFWIRKYPDPDPDPAKKSRRIRIRILNTEIMIVEIHEGYVWSSVRHVRIGRVKSMFTLELVDARTC